LMKGTKRMSDGRWQKYWYYVLNFTPTWISKINMN
jgi:hypothetical protein